MRGPPAHSTVRSGLSGFIRKRALHSENTLRHWMLLLLADRVSAVEGLIDDARRTPAAVALAGTAFVIAAGLLFRSRNRF